VIEAAEAGRFWHAGERLKDSDFADPSRPELVLARARLAAGWRDWAGVVDLLEGRDWLSEEDAGSGLLLLGRAREAREEWGLAANAYTWWLADQAPERDLRVAVTVRLALALAEENRGQASLLYLDGLLYDRPFLTSWARMRAASILAEEGDTLNVPLLLERVTDDVARDRSRFLTADARLQAGDSLGAEEAFLEGLAYQGGSEVRTALGWARLGDLRRLRADTAAAMVAYREALTITTRGAGAVRAARHLVDLREQDPDRLLRMTDALRLGGEPARAVRIYQRWLNVTGGEPADLPGPHRLRRALILDPAGERSAAVRELRALSESDDPEVAVPALVGLANARRRQGRSGDRRAVQDELVRRFPSSEAAVDVIFFRADDAQDAGSYEVARQGYARAVEMSSAVNRAGLARMRWGQIHLHRGEYGEAAAVFEGYLAEFPDGRRWDEAMFWAGSARLDGGDEVAARSHFEELRRRNPVSYYTVMAGTRMGWEFEVPTVPVQVTVPTPEWVLAGVASLDLLREAGLEDARSEARRRLIRQAQGDPEALVPLGEYLNARGDTWEGLNLGLDARRLGLDWDDRLLRVVYPFPDAAAVFQEAREQGVDPWLVAGVIRQESAFNATAVSSAGAVGMMQVMPATGRQLARARGPSGFTRETLFTAEINVHLGSAFLADLLERFGPELANVLVAYNAGPTRIQRWRNLPEAEDALRFTERIPFTETRGYVKAVKRNMALYEWLYGDELSRLIP
jgi:soluble lytic murein transglycosylase